MADWSRMRTAQRYPVPAVIVAEVPAKPGVYCWWRDGEPVYVGEAKVSLRRRIGDHLSTGPDLSRSTLRRSVALAELGIPRTMSSARPSQVNQVQADVVSLWLRGCDLSWIQCDAGAEAHALEVALRAEWLPSLNRV